MGGVLGAGGGRWARDRYLLTSPGWLVSGWHPDRSRAVPYEAPSVTGGATQSPVLKVPPLGLKGDYRSVLPSPTRPPKHPSVRPQAPGAQPDHLLRAMSVPPAPLWEGKTCGHCRSARGSASLGDGATPGYVSGSPTPRGSPRPASTPPTSRVRTGDSMSSGPTRGREL